MCNKTHTRILTCAICPLLALLCTCLCLTCLPERCPVNSGTQSDLANRGSCAMAIRETAKVIDIPLPEFQDLTNDSMPQKEKLAVRAVTAMGAQTAIFKNVREVQLKNTQDRCCTDQWLDENEREWMILDALCRSRPWATNKDKPFPYPFKEATDRMREVEGPWVGDEQPFPREWTREAAADEVLTNITQIKEYPPASFGLEQSNSLCFVCLKKQVCPVWIQAFYVCMVMQNHSFEFEGYFEVWYVLECLKHFEHLIPRRRLLLFTPEFGSVSSFDRSTWSQLDADLWVVSWQGWTSWSEMIEQVTRQVLSLADGVSTVWYGHSMGALVAYEVLKRFETKYCSPDPQMGEHFQPFSTSVHSVDSFLLSKFHDGTFFARRLNLVLTVQSSMWPATKS